MQLPPNQPARAAQDARPPHSAPSQHPAQLPPLPRRWFDLSRVFVGKITQKSAAELSFKTKNGVKFSFFGGTYFVRRAGKIQTNDGVLRLANLRALLATKLKATCDRARYKDYFDIVAILKRGVSLRDGLAGVGVF